MDDPTNHIAVFVAAVATVIAWYAFRQSRDALAVDEKRKKTITAIEQNDKLTNAMASLHHSLEERCNKERRAWESEPPKAPFALSRELENDAKLFGNMLETWALYVQAEMADEELLYETSGGLFCLQVLSLSRFAVLSSTNAEETWPPVYRLFQKWRPRIEAERERKSG